MHDRVSEGREEKARSGLRHAEQAMKSRKEEGVKVGPRRIGPGEETTGGNK